MVGHRLLTVKKASKNDTGSYECLVVDHNKNKNRENYYVEVNDETYFNITAVTNESGIEVPAERSMVHWVVNYEAHPDATAQWTNPKGEIIMTDSAYEVTTNKTVTSLSIKNVTLEKAGQYTLELKNSNITKKEFNKLIVNGKPYNVTISQINNENKNREILSSTKAYTFRCHALLHPGGVMKWQFTPCAQYNECNKERELTTGKPTNYSVREYSLVSEIQIPIIESGYLTCIATNMFGNASVEQPFFILDSPRGFEVTKHSKLVEKNDMELNCSVSKYIYDDNIRWLKDGEDITKKDGFVVSESDTKFSFRSTLKVNALRRQHTGNYTCTVQKRGGPRVGRSLNIKVHKMKSVKKELKSAAWKNIEQVFNANVLGRKCSVKELQELWKLLKKSAKSEHSQWKIQCRMTGGGPQPSDISQEVQDCLKTLGASYDEIDNIFDDVYTTGMPHPKLARPIEDTMSTTESEDIIEYFQTTVDPPVKPH